MAESKVIEPCCCQHTALCWPTKCVENRVGLARCAPRRVDFQQDVLGLIKDDLLEVLADNHDHIAVLGIVTSRHLTNTVQVRLQLGCSNSCWLSSGSHIVECCLEGLQCHSVHVLVLKRASQLTVAADSAHGSSGADLL